MEFKFKYRYEYTYDIVYGTISRNIILSANTRHIIKSSIGGNSHTLYHINKYDEIIFIHTFDKDSYNKFKSFIKEKSRVKTIEELLT